MNTYLLGLISKWVSIVSLSVAGLFNSGSLFSEEKIEVDNINQTKNWAASITELAYDTTTIYNSKLPKDMTITKKEGQNGLAYKDNLNNTVEIIENPVNAVVEVGTGDYGQFVGKISVMAPIALDVQEIYHVVTKSGKTWSLTRGGETYVDDEYGKVNILAAALSKFPCGTIIKVQNPGLGTFNAVVMDTGGAMKAAWQNGVVHMDLAFISETSKGVHYATSSNVKYSVQRWGW
ncbi:MAG: hypothetical protein V8R01_02610 [Bacilli bacterium]